MILLLYLFIVFFWYLKGCHNENTRENYILITTISILMIMGLRNSAIYNDTIGYVLDYKSLGNRSLDEIIENNHKDPYFWVFSYYVNIISGGSYTVWLLIISAVYVVPVANLIRRFSLNPMISWVAFFFLGLFLFAMAGLRQTMAMGLVIIAFLNLTKNKQLWFFVFLGVAYLFHSSSLIALLIYPIVKYKIEFTKKSIFLYILMIAVVIAVGSVLLRPLTVFLGKYDARYADYYFSEGSTFTYLLQQLCLVIPSLYILQERLEERKVSLFAHLSMIAIVFVSGSPVIAELFRISMYFSWAQIILFAMAMHEINYRNQGSQAIFLLLMTFYMAFNGTLLQEYFFYFQDASDYALSHFDFD